MTVTATAALARDGSPPGAVARRPVVVVVGNPNTGKSVLFNALTGLRQKVALLDNAMSVGRAKRNVSEIVDRVAVHPVFGSLLFVGLMAVVFQAVFSWAAPLMELLDGVACGRPGVARATSATPPPSARASLRSPIPRSPWSRSNAARERESSGREGSA